MVRKQTLETCENIKVQRWHKNISTSHITRSLMVQSFCRLELPQPSYHSVKTPYVFMK